MTEIPEKYRDLFQKKAFAHIATVMSDGSPQVTPVWFDAEDGLVRINTARGRTKDRNLKPGVKVALSIQDPDDPYRQVQIRGTVIEETEKGASDHIDALSKKYLGRDVYPFHDPKHARVIYKIEPSSFQSNR